MTTFKELAEAWIASRGHSADEANRMNLDSVP